MLLLEITKVAHSGQGYSGNTNLASLLVWHSQACHAMSAIGHGANSCTRWDRPHSRQASVLLLSKLPLAWVIAKIVSGNETHTHAVYEPIVSNNYRDFMKFTSPNSIPTTCDQFTRSAVGSWNPYFVKSCGRFQWIACGGNQEVTAGSLGAQSPFYTKHVWTIRC